MREKPFVHRPMLKIGSWIRRRAGFDGGQGPFSFGVPARVSFGRSAEKFGQRKCLPGGRSISQGIPRGGLHQPVDGKAAGAGIEIGEREPVQCADGLAKPGQVCGERLKRRRVDFGGLGEQLLGDVLGREERGEREHGCRAGSLRFGLGDGELEGREHRRLVGHAFRRIFHAERKFGEVIVRRDRGIVHEIGGGMAESEREAAELLSDGRERARR